MDDEGDFKKARGFLLTYSALVLALWYFGADLTQFKLMGNEIKLHQRTESVWLVLAALNAYFWFRFYQRIPPKGLHFDSEMQKLYSSTLEKLAIWLGGNRFKQNLTDQIQSSGLSFVEFELINYGAQGGKLYSRVSTPTPGVKTLKSYFYSLRREVGISLVASYRFRGEGGWQRSTIPFQYIHYLGPHVAWSVKGLTIVRGAFITPWFTDHIAPLILGGISTGFALWKWYDMNFFTATLPHLAQSCAGITH